MGFKGVHLVCFNNTALHVFTSVRSFHHYNITFFHSLKKLQLEKSHGDITGEGVSLQPWSAYVP